VRTALETIHLPGGRTIRRGDSVPDDDPALAGREHLFGAPWAPVEQATAAPGERRASSRRG
jgi:hypothetical protein